MATPPLTFIHVVWGEKMKKMILRLRKAIQGSSVQKTI
jgi:hypothetical protein